MEVANWKEYISAILSSNQRVELTHDFFDGVEDAERKVSLSESDITELRRRISEAKTGQMARYPIEEVRQRLRDQD